MSFYYQMSKKPRSLHIEPQSFLFSIKRSNIDLLGIFLLLLCSL